MRDRYIFPAIFDYADDGISVSFPDIQGCITCGNADEQAIQMAEEALSLHWMPQVRQEVLRQRLGI
jgi:predicted RNase H-like HicB family nuclease